MYIESSCFTRKYVQGHCLMEEKYVCYIIGKHIANLIEFFVLTIFNEVAYMTIKSNFHKALNLF